MGQLSAVISRPAPSNAAEPRRRREWLAPGWPLTVAVAGYPLWWLLGVAGIVPLVAGVLMAVQLGKMRRVKVPSGFGWWLLFLAWVAVGVALLQVPAPHAIPDHSGSRYVTFAFRCGWYLTATIAAVYLYNMRERLSTQRVLRAFSWLFVTVVVGGIAGSIAPYLDFPSLVEVVLPRHLTHVQYVHDLVHPVMAQLHTEGTVVQPRASAPFAYTNDWGLNYAFALPFFVLGWLARGNGWRRIAGAIILAASVYPVVMTQNRGLWLTLGVLAVVVAVRAWLFGRSAMLVAVLALTAVLAVVLVVTPLGSKVTSRLANGYSDTGRATLSSLTVNSVVEKSPVVGYGTTRNVQGAFYSIAGGDTATCSNCSPPALGTQGHFWLVIFSAGVGGLILYLVFIGLQLVRAARRNTVLGTLALTVLAAHVTTMFVYDTIGIALVSIFVAIGLLWRDRPDGSRDRRLGGYATFTKANALIIAGCAAVGALAGFGYAGSQPTQYSTVVNLGVPAGVTYPNVPKFAPTLDTVADLIDATPVHAAAVRAAGGPRLGQFTVTATANSQVLHIQYLDTNRARSARVAIAAARAVDAQRMALVNQARSDALYTLNYQDSIATSMVARIDGLRDVPPGSLLTWTRDDLLTQLSDDAATIADIQARPVDPSTITVARTVMLRSQAGLVDACSGFAIGLLIGVMLGFARDMIGRRVGRRFRGRSLSGMWVLMRLGDDVGQQLPQAVQILGLMGAGRVVSADPSTAALAVCAQLNAALRATSGDQVALLADARTRVRQLITTRDRLNRSGAQLCGLMLTGQELAGVDARPGGIGRTVMPPATQPQLQRT